MADTSLLNKSLSITIFGPDKVLYQGNIKALTSVNDAGRFDVLPLHSNFISIIRDFLILHESDNKNKEMKFREGVLKVFGDDISIFLGIEGLK